MAATSLKYYESSREKGKWLLRLEVDLENHSDGTVDFDSFNADDMDYCLTGRTVEPNSEKKTSLAFDFENWNNLLGETKDSFLGTYAVRISKHKDDGTIGELLEEVNFDWYASEKSPFANITVGGAEEPTTEEGLINDGKIFTGRTLTLYDPNDRSISMEVSELSQGGWADQNTGKIYYQASVGSLIFQYLFRH